MDGNKSPTKKIRLNEIQLHSYHSQGSVGYAVDYKADNVKLFEIPTDILKSLQSGKCLKIVGQEKGDAVLCTKDSTFAIKRVETSNSVFLVPPSSSDVFQIAAKTSHYFELSPIRGKIDMIKDLLSSTQFRGIEDNMDPKTLMTRSQLESLISASSDEIDLALKNLNVVEFGAERKLRMLARDVLNDTIRSIIDTIIENGWDTDNLRKEEIMSNIKDIHEVFIQHIFHTYSEAAPQDGYISIKYDTMARLTADILFRYRPNNSNLWTAEDFLTVWSSRTPGVGTPSESLLKGIALKEYVTVGHTSVLHYKYLSAEDLSSDVKTRFSQLFEAKPKLTLEELQPYFQGYFGGVGQARSLAELALQNAKLIDGNYMAK